MGYFLDNAQMTVSGTPGTGNITLDTATAGHQDFATAGVASGQFISYAIQDTGNTFEYGRGFYSSSGPTLIRTTILGSSNSGSAISATSSALITATALAEDLAPTPWSITGGLPSSITGSNTSATMTVGAGVATSQDLAARLSWGSFNWAASNGNAANGCADGTTLTDSVTYHMYICWGSSGYCSYASQSISMAASAAPSGYQSYVRRVASFDTNSAGSPIPATFIEVEGGAYVAWLATQTLDVSTVSLGTSRVLYKLNVPGGGLKLQPIFRAVSNSASETVIFTSGDETDVAPTAVGALTVPLYDTGQPGSGQAAISTPYLTTDTSGRIGARALAASKSLYVVTRGWKDWRRV